MIRSRKERIATAKKSFRELRKTPELFEQEAWTEALLIDDLAKEYRKEADNFVSEEVDFNNEIDKLNYKIRCAITPQEQRKYAREILSIENKLINCRANITYFSYIANLLEEAYLQIDTLIKRKKFYKVVSLIPEHKLVAYSRSSRGQEKLREFVKAVRDNIVEATIKIMQESDEYSKEKNRSNAIFSEASALSGNTQTQMEDDIIARAINKNGQQDFVAVELPEKEDQLIDSKNNQKIDNKN